MTQQMVELFARWDVDLAGLKRAPIGVLAAAGRLWRTVFSESFVPAFEDVVERDERLALGACERATLLVSRIHEHPIGWALRAANCHVTFVFFEHPVSPDGLSTCDCNANRAGDGTHAGHDVSGVGTPVISEDVSAVSDMAEAIAGAKC
jgi:hypothetical protein